MAYGNLFSAPLTLTGSVTVDRLHVREKPDKQSAIIANLPKGASIAIHNHLNGWYEINHAYPVDAECRFGV